jgi:hypothetical protein
MKPVLIRMFLLDDLFPAPAKLCLLRLILRPIGCSAKDYKSPFGPFWLEIEDILEGVDV